LGDNGVLFYPSFPTTAGYHYAAYLKPFNFGYTCLFNVLRFPCCQVPLGLDEGGMPVGIQVRQLRKNLYLNYMLNTIYIPNKTYFLSQIVWKFSVIIV